MPPNSFTTNAVLKLGVPASVTVDGRSDVFSAGMKVADKGRGGVLPARLALAPGGGYITISAIRGKVGCGPGKTSTDDGGSCAGGNTALKPAGGMSGITDHDHSQFLVGAFVGSEQAPTPATLDFSKGSKGEAFAQLSPALKQVFFIGDGRTGTGAGQAQRFNIPAGATALYLGYADGYAFQGKPGWYSDNTGGQAVTVVQHAPGS